MPVEAAAGFLASPLRLARNASMRLITRAGGCTSQQLDQLRLVVILEFLRIEMGGLGLDNMGSQLAHLGRQLDVRDVLEIGGLVANLVGIAQRRRQQPLVEGLDHRDVLAPGEDYAAEPHHLLLADGIADDREGLLADLIGGRDVVRALDIAIVDLLARHEAFDLERMRALDLDLLDLLVLDLNVLALADLVAAADVLLVHRLGGLRIDQLLLEPVAGLLVDPVERHSLRAGRSRIQSDRTGYQRELQVALPISTRGHDYSYNSSAHRRF